MDLVTGACYWLVEWPLMLHHLHQKYCAWLMTNLIILSLSAVSFEYMFGGSKVTLLASMVNRLSLTNRIWKRRNNVNGVGVRRRQIDSVLSNA